MTFTAETRLPIAAVTRLAQAQYESSPLVQLDPAQVSLLEAFSSLYPYQQLGIARAALESKRSYISGADVLAMTQSASATEQPEFAGEQ